MEQKEPIARLQLSLSCHNLLDLDTFSKSDPQVHVFLWSHDSGSWTLIGKTEVVWNNLNPVFAKSFIIDYKFEEVQNMKLIVVDVDEGTGEKPIDEQDFLGLAEVTIAQIFTSKNQTLVLDLLNKKKTGKTKGTIQVIAEEIPTNDQFEIVFQFSARDLVHQGFFGSPHPFYVISRSREDGSWVKVFSSDTHRGKNVDWLPVTSKLSVLVGGDRDRTLQFEVFDYARLGGHKLIGSFRSSLNELEKRKGQAIPLLTQKKRQGGLFFVNKISFHQTKSFLDYIAEGLDVNLIVSIDFTSSNGDPSKPDSLHYRSRVMNPYQLALKAVGEILLEYDTDKRVPVFGFGAKFADGTISHCFPLNGVADNPEVYGVQGMLDVYNHAMSHLTLWGPTNFAPFLRTTENIIRNALKISPKKYFILLVITDGVITDMESTMQAIIDLSSLPLSIVIVGVGGADFTNMKILDGDEQILSYNGRNAERDIVQFVPFAQINSPHILARETLEEVPYQVTSYMRKYEMSPSDREWTEV